MDKSFIYDMQLPEKVSNILETDFWVLENINKIMLPAASDPIKFSSNVSILVKKGNCKAEVNLITHTIEAPAVVSIKSSQILQLMDVSDDFEASFVVMSRRFCDNLFLLLQDCKFYPVAVRTPIVELPVSLLPKFIDLYSRIGAIFRDSANPFAYQTMTLALGSFFFETAYLIFEDTSSDELRGNNRISSKFIGLVQQNFKNERFLEFYAEKLDISTKHLSRTMKSTTGFTAVEWIERYVILEAKVLLKSTNLNIQQISDELNFHSQSFFGKYFKKNTGMTPKEFRNT